MSTNTRISEATRQGIAKAWPAILDGLANGGLIRDALRKAGFSRDAVDEYKRSTPGAKEQWEIAREQSADSFMDEAVATANDRKLDPAHARVKVDTLKWAARIRNPRLYGDKAQLDVNVRTVDLTRIIQDANARLANARRPLLDVSDAEILAPALLPETLKKLM